MSTKRIFENVNLGQAEDLIMEYIDKNDDDEFRGGGIEELIQEDEECQLWQSPNYIHVPELGVKIHDFVCCNRNDDGEYDEDWSGWIFRDDKTNEIMYDEGYSSFYAAVYNFSKRCIDEFICDIYIVSGDI